MKMDLLILGHPRSGSTVLAEVLHCPSEGQLMLDEPHPSRIFGTRKRPGLAVRPGFEVLKWGMKQVSAPRWQWGLGLDPRSVVVTVRDPLHSMLSYAERCSWRWDREAFPDEWRKSVTKRLRKVATSAEAVVQHSSSLKKRGVLWHRYEDFVEDPDAALESLEEATGWKTDRSNVGRFISKDRRLGGRKKEAGRHEGRITSRGHELRSRQAKDLAEKDPVLHSMLSDFQERIHPYREMFGYA